MLASLSLFPNVVRIGAGHDRSKAGRNQAQNPEPSVRWENNARKAPISLARSDTARKCRLAALTLGLFCIATATLFHTNFGNRNELLHFEKDLAIAGGLFALGAVAEMRVRRAARIHYS